jgi:Asp-tRNA(Asn)/Glu-tRNA(Gln) amidotransferase A subunit family amidase
MNDLPYLPATEALRLFRARELSPVELLTVVIERAETVARPLEGLPVAVREGAPIAGQRNTLGSRPLRDEVAGRTAAFAQRILDAGGIVHARTTTPEFSCAPVT